VRDLDAALAKVRARYEASLAEHGPDSPLAVHWNDAGTQALRFDVLAQVIEDGAPVTVADFGCGTGALFERLAARAAPELAGYVGYDIVPGFVEAARARVTDPRARFELASEVTEDADYVLASGALTVRPAAVADQEWEEHVRERVAGLWARARRGLAFNLLVRDEEPLEDGLYAGDPVGWATWCSRELEGALVALRQGPPLPDFAVLVRRAR
jgi:SAM-dependent methyltransferase